MAKREQPPLTAYARKQVRLRASGSAGGAEAERPAGHPDARTASAEAPSAAPARGAAPAAAQHDPSTSGAAAAAGAAAGGLQPGDGRSSSGVAGGSDAMGASEGAGEGPSAEGWPPPYDATQTWHCHWPGCQAAGPLRGPGRSALASYFYRHACRGHGSDINYDSSPRLVDGCREHATAIQRAHGVGTDPAWVRRDAAGADYAAASLAAPSPPTRIASQVGNG